MKFQSKLGNCQLIPGMADFSHGVHKGTQNSASGNGTSNENNDLAIITR